MEISSGKEFPISDPQNPKPMSFLKSRHGWPHSIFFGLRLLSLLLGMGFAFCISLVDPAVARTSPATVCDSAAAAAATNHGVPLDVLLAITRVETGRAQNSMLYPWPWTVNMEGAGKWFQTEDEARAYVFTHFKSGARSFDVGCFQINYKWHGTAFRSIDEMFDPAANADYAARFLKSLFDELGDWSSAAGAYHSRTPTYATRYASRFDKIRSRLSSETVETPSVSVETPPGQPKPLGISLSRRLSPLTAQGPVKLGSLVPVVQNPLSPSILPPRRN